MRKTKKLMSAMLSLALIAGTLPNGGLVAKAASDDVYVLINIPYADFFQAEGDSDVDIVSSATKTKTKTGSLVAGSYHETSDGDTIAGITYPVKTNAEGLEALKAKGYKEITDSDSVEITVTNRGNTSTTVYEGSDALFEAASYSYYVSATDYDFYKELIVDGAGNISFGKSQAKETNSNAKASITTVSKYGDYQISISDADFDTGATVYAVTLETSDGEVYGLRHLENVWRGTELAWSTGHTLETHNCPLSYADYQNMEGKTIKSIKYYTENGNYEISTELYVAPYYSTEAYFEGLDSLYGDSIPADAENAKVSVYYTTGEGREAVNTYIAENVSVNDSNAALTEAAEYGVNYTVVITADNYATVTTSASYKEYSIIDGADGSYEQESNESVKISSDAELDVFHAVRVNGEKLDASAYTLESGSTIVQLNNDYLDKLDAGTYTIDILSKDGIATTALTITAAPDKEDSEEDTGNGQDDENSAGDDDNASDVNDDKTTETDIDNSSDAADNSANTVDNSNSSNQTDSQPATGDETPVNTLFALLALSAIGAAAAIRKKKEIV